MDNRIIVNKKKSKRGFRYTLKCIFCNQVFILLGFKFNEGQGKYCSLECANKCPQHKKNMDKNRPSQEGINNGNYKNGKWMYVHARKSFCKKCRITLNELLKRPGKFKKIPLIVHHIDHDRENPNPANLMTLCDSCHKKIHKFGQKIRNKQGQFIKIIK